MPNFYSDSVEPVKKATKRATQETVKGFVPPGDIETSTSPKPDPGVTKESPRTQGLSVSTAPRTVSLNQNGSAVMVNLPYTSTGGAIPTSCKADSLSNVVEAPPCTCSGGTCRVGIQAKAGLYGRGSFAFRLFDSQEEGSNVGKVNVRILPVTISCYSGNVRRGIAGEKLPSPIVVLVQNSDNAPASRVKVNWEALVKDKNKGRSREGHRVCFCLIFDQDFDKQTEVIFTPLVDPGLPAKLAFLPDYPTSVLAGEELSKLGVWLVDTHGN